MPTCDDFTQTDKERETHPQTRTKYVEIIREVKVDRDPPPRRSIRTNTDDKAYMLFACNALHEEIEQLLADRRKTGDLLERDTDLMAMTEALIARVYQKSSGHLLPSAKNADLLPSPTKSWHFNVNNVQKETVEEAASRLKRLVTKAKPHK